MTKKADTGKPMSERALKWIAAVTAVLSLVFAIQKLTDAIAENGDRSRRIEELTQVAARQQQSGDYSLAWESLATATKLADGGGTYARMLGNLDADSSKIRIARENLAMQWLDNISVPSGQGFSTTVEKLMPVLEEGALAADKERKGDLLAHIGYGYFLRGRDGGTRIDPVPQYEQAIAADANNPFAHAYWGHWTLWNGRNFDEANQHFRAALDSKRERSRVRALQLSAYKNRGSDGDIAYVKTVAEMLKNNESVDQAAQKLALWNITRACKPTGSRSWLAELKTAIPKDDLAVVFKTLSGPPQDPTEADQQSKCLAAIDAK